MDALIGGHFDKVSMKPEIQDVIRLPPRSGFATAGGVGGSIWRRTEAICFLACRMHAMKRGTDQAGWGD